MTSSSATYDRVVERRRAVALARHFREAEGLSIAQIAGLHEAVRSGSIEPLPGSFYRTAGDARSADA